MGIYRYIRGHIACFLSLDIKKAPTLSYVSAFLSTILLTQVLFCITTNSYTKVFYHIKKTIPSIVLIPLYSTVCKKFISTRVGLSMLFT